MKFSLIIGTLNRSEAIKSCLKSIFEQTYTDYEIIIIDQSNNNTTENYIKVLNSSNIIYRHVEFKGLSKARNEALKFASGEYFCLIDDDAYYQNNYLEKASMFLENKTILSGYIFDTIKQNSFVKYKKRFNEKYVSLRMIMRLCPSAALVFPMNIIREVGVFDEQFGVGAKYGSGEETDLILRGLQRGYRVKYIENMKLNHPVPNYNSKDGDETIKKVQYFEGLGALFKKHYLDGKIYELKFCYIELILKFKIKLILRFVYENDVIKSQYKGFLRGLRGSIL